MLVSIVLYCFPIHAKLLPNRCIFALLYFSCINYPPFVQITDYFQASH